MSRSSGVADIDNYALTSIKNMRYKERPPGCGVLENQATVYVDSSGSQELSQPPRCLF